MKTKGKQYDWNFIKVTSYVRKDITGRGTTEVGFEEQKTT